MVFTAGDIIEAHLLQALLRSQGIDAVIKNENLQTGLGELPFVEMWPEIWLIERRDWDKAQRLLAGFVVGETTGKSGVVRYAANGIPARSNYAGYAQMFRLMMADEFKA